MTECPPEIMIERCAAGELPDTESQAIRDHAASCTRCGELLLGAIEDLRLLRELRGAAATMAGPSPSDLLPSEIAGMPVIRLLGEGGCSIVYEVQQSEPRRIIALKVLRDWRHASARRAAMFEREALALARLDLPQIARVYFSGRTRDGQPFVAMERVHGARFDEYARGTGRDIARLVSLTASIAEGIQAVHERGVVHRDLKPANILVEGSGDPKVLDFGLARISGGDGSLATIYAEGSGLLGTLPYMAPEQIRGDPVAIDGRCDQYALAAVLFEGLTGRHPHAIEGLTPAEAAARICSVAAPPATDIRNDTPPSVSAVIARALSLRPDDRFSSMGEFAASLRACSSAQAHERPTTSGSRSSAVSWGHAALIVAIGVLTVSALVLRSRVWVTGSSDAENAPLERDAPAVAPAPSTGASAGELRDTRIDGQPGSQAVAVFISTYHYVVGDPQAAYERELKTVDEHRRAPTSREERNGIDAEVLLRAGLAAEAANRRNEALALFTEAGQSTGRNRFAGNTRAARLASNMIGCEASEQIRKLERAAGVPKGISTMHAFEAWVVVAAHWAACGDGAAATKALQAAREAHRALPSTVPHEWVDAELARVTAAVEK